MLLGGLHLLLHLLWAGPVLGHLVGRLVGCPHARLHGRWVGRWLRHVLASWLLAQVGLWAMLVHGRVRLVMWLLRWHWLLLTDHAGRWRC